ncbi:MAG TPA: hypothetical protein VKP08_03910, partial [Anaerolineales bacterium]|nr:hypothetical protein [Anaerolineales bacterium]
VLSMSVSANRRITDTGDISPVTFPERRGSFMHMFRADELMKWLEQKELQVVDLSASNCISLTWNEMLKQIRCDCEKWNELLRMEVEACADPGCLNMGTHLIAVAEKRQAQVTVDRAL